MGSSQSINSTVIKLAKENRYNDIFNGTKFTLSIGNNANDLWHMSPSVYSAGSPQYYSWSRTLSAESQFIGIDMGNNIPNKMSFKPAYKNPSNFVIGWSNNVGQAVMTGNADSPSAEKNQWQIEYASDATPDPKFVIFYMSIYFKFKNNNIGFGKYVETFKNGQLSPFNVVALVVVDPGPSLLKEYCTNAEQVNVSSVFCKSYCEAHTAECNNHIGELCEKPENMSNDSCVKWCNTSSVANCDKALKDNCQKLLTDKYSNNVSNLLNSFHGQSCACFLPDSTMQGYANSLRDQYGFNVPVQNALCFYPPCSLNATKVVVPYVWKMNCGNCAKDSGCITAVEIDVQGSLLHPPLIFQSNMCKRFLGNQSPVVNQTASTNSNKPFYTGPDDKPTIPNACIMNNDTPKIPKINHVGHKTTSVVTIMVVVVVLAIVIGLIIYMEKGHSSSNVNLAMLSSKLSKLM